jgi:hypothetical protein
VEVFGMKTLDKLLAYKIDTIAIVDNDGDDGPEMMLPSWEAGIAGFKTIHVPQSLQSIPAIVDFIQKHAQAAICAHRLGTYKHPLFYGAELAAALYDAGIPTVLVTQYLDIDQHTSIRRWREKIPVVLHFCEFESSTLGQHLDFCVKELQGNVPQSRLPYRVMLGVEHVEGMEGNQYIDVSVGCWDRHQRVRMPMALIPPPLRAQIEPGSWLFAMVNVEADYAYELYFRDFAVAPEPQCDENLTYCVNVLDGVNESEHPLLWLEMQRIYDHPIEIDVFNVNDMGKDMWN